MSLYSVRDEANRRASEISIDRYSKRGGDHDDDLHILGENEILPVYRAKNGLSWAECIFQIFFSLQGPTFFILPSGLRDLGYLPGIIIPIVLGLLYMHIMHTLLWCEQEVRRRNNIDEGTNLSLATLINLTFVRTKRVRAIGKYLKSFLKYEIILSWSFNLSFNELFICQNIRIVLNHFGYNLSDNLLLIALFPLTTALSLVPDLKVMSVIAYASSVVLIMVMFEILYFVMTDPSTLPAINMIGNDLGQVSTFAATVFITVTFTPLAFSMQQEMKKRQQFGSCFGSLNVAIAMVLALNICFSLLVYLRYGAATQDNIMQNLPNTLLLVVSNSLLTATLISSGSILFFVIFETVWCGSLLAMVSQSRYTKVYEYMARILINFFITVVALIVPSLSMFINLMSCFSCPFDSILLPAVLQFTLVSGSGRRDTQWVLVTVKTVVLVVIGLVFAGTSFVTFVTELVAIYMKA